MEPNTVSFRSWERKNLFQTTWDTEIWQPLKSDFQHLISEKLTNLVYPSNGCNPIYSSCGYRKKNTLRGRAKVRGRSFQPLAKENKCTKAKGNSYMFQVCSSLDFLCSFCCTSTQGENNYALRTRRPRPEVRGLHKHHINVESLVLNISRLIWKVLIGAFKYHRPSAKVCNPLKHRTQCSRTRRRSGVSHRVPIHLLSAEMRHLGKAPSSRRCEPRDTLKRLHAGDGGVGMKCVLRAVMPAAEAR